MRTIHYVFILLLVASTALVRYDIFRRENLATVAKENQTAGRAIGDLTANMETNSEKAAVNKSTNASVMASVEASAQAFAIIKKEQKIFIAKFKNESAQIAKIQNDPELVQKRMKKLANAMTSQNVKALYNIISDDKRDGDQRALAVELLSIKNDTTSLFVLQNFVANNTTVNGSTWDRKKELETILRAQAVESIAAYPQKDIALSTLSYLQHKVDESFLIDRINRAAANLNNKAPTLLQQDEAALKKLVE